GHHLRQLTASDLAARVTPFLDKRGLHVDPSDARLLAAAPLVAPRATTLADAADALDYFFREPPVVDEKAKQKFMTPEARERMTTLASVIENVTPFEHVGLES